MTLTPFLSPRSYTRPCVSFVSQAAALTPRLSFRSSQCRTSVPRRGPYVPCAPLPLHHDVGTRLDYSIFFFAVRHEPCSIRIGIALRWYYIKRENKIILVILMVFWDNFFIFTVGRSYASIEIETKGLFFGHPPKPGPSVSPRGTPR